MIRCSFFGLMFHSFDVPSQPDVLFSAQCPLPLTFRLSLMFLPLMLLSPPSLGCIGEAVNHRTTRVPGRSWIDRNDSSDTFRRRHTVISPTHVKKTIMRIVQSRVEEGESSISEFYVGNFVSSSSRSPFSVIHVPTLRKKNLRELSRHFGRATEEFRVVDCRRDVSRITFSNVCID